MSTLPDVARPLLREKAFIGGSWIATPSSRVINVLNPVDQTVVGHVPNLDAAEVSQAIAAAEAALRSWRALAARERAVCSKRWHALVLENLECLALQLTGEQKKVLAEARGEIAYGASFLEWFAEEAKRGSMAPLSPRRSPATGSATRSRPAWSASTKA